MRGALKMAAVPLEWEAEANDARFEAALALIHGVDGAPEHPTLGMGMDTRQAEMQAMFDAYLGVGYDREKVYQVLDLQNSLHNFQSRLLDDYEHQLLDPVEYVNSVNDAIRLTFETCETVLGASDFERLFGGSVADVGGYIDLQAFLQSERGDEAESRV